MDYKRVTIAVLVLALIVPFLTFAGNSKKVYVDKQASSAQDGSSSHPYKTVSQALKNAKKNTKVYVSKGTYHENLVVPKGVQIYGEGRDETIIRARTDDDSAVYLNGGASLYNLGIENGRNGVKVADGGRVKIIKCRIRDNNQDGVVIYSGRLNDDNKVTISKTEIKDNGKNGVYSEKRNIDIDESDINYNGSDGVSLESGTKAWIAGTNFRKNYGSGLKVKLDGAQIYTKNNLFDDNAHEGVEVNAYGAAGRVDINEGKFNDNANFAISRVQRGIFPASIWNGLTVRNSSFTKTNSGTISGIFKIIN